MSLGILPRLHQARWLIALWFRERQGKERNTEQQQRDNQSQHPEAVV